jgi:solute carrier family 25 carnitine/acylcarnitine transporter 20/29
MRLVNFISAFSTKLLLQLWLSAYPIDVVKSRMQTDAISPSQRQFKSSLHCTQQIYKTAGLAAFFRGLTPTLVRAPFANAATFVVYEWASQQLEPYVFK